jgi:hypothetical protein
MATDITMHDDSELSLIFDNDEFLYGQARAAVHFENLEELAREFFIFTDDQLDEFKTDWEGGNWE